MPAAPTAAPLVAASLAPLCLLPASGQPLRSELQEAAVWVPGTLIGGWGHTKGAPVPGVHWGRAGIAQALPRDLPGSASRPRGQQLRDHKLFLDRLLGTLF